VAGRRELPQRECGEQSDRTGADDECGAAVAEAGAPGDVHRARQRADDRGGSTDAHVPVGPPAMALARAVASGTVVMTKGFE